jgi:hypothetical protein
VLARLCATNDWQAIRDEYVVDRRPPATPLGELDAAWWGRAARRPDGALSRHAAPDGTARPRVREDGAAGPDRRRSGPRRGARGYCF